MALAAVPHLQIILRKIDAAKLREKVKGTVFQRRTESASILHFQISNIYVCRFPCFHTDLYGTRVKLSANSLFTLALSVDIEM